ncbi:SEL1-like repeat protein [Selenomonas dianae]|uniref:Sel1 repeat protein n=1 Tax=Selenomonas dianae TaxID=135079 RepID=A0ABN0SWR4_9FIRM|nr:tetratricopeptide repeat protein [Selenomonas dianae]WLD82931.1 tetratricopeptide repeat protein [Selenomonas dianae]
MARKVKFPLELRDGYLARSNIEEVRAHFDLEKIIAQFHNGRLKIWLEDHYLPEMAEQVAAIDGDASDLAAQLCAILGVEGVATENVDSNLIQRREEKRQRLSQYTTNPILCDMAEFAAFEQSDLDRLIKEGAQEIILCKENFRIPLNVKNKTYLGVGNAVAVIDSKTAVDFETLGIRFVDLPFDEKYREAVADEPRRYFEQGQQYEEKGKDKKAVECYQKAIDLGCDDAIFALAELYEKQGNEEDMIRLLVKAGNQGNVAAMERLETHFEEVEDYRSAIWWTEKKAKLGDANAMWWMGIRYRDGEWVERDLEKAFEWFQKSAKAEDANGMCLLGDCYRDGKGTGHNIEEAIHWYEKSAALENSYAMWRLGMLYDAGNGVPENPVLGAEWYRKSAEAGNVQGMYYLALDYEYGTGVEQDDAEAKKWYRKAADEGYAPAQRRIGRYYADEGKYKDAMRWYEKAAEQGDGVSMNRIALLYSNGKGVRQDAKKAFVWFQRSAEAGFGWGMSNLANCYDNGDGVQENFDLAWKWYAKAAGEGIRPAIKWMNGHIINAHVMAELCSVMILGRLKSGKILWAARGYLQGGYTYGIEPDLVSSDEWIQNGIIEREETVIGGAKSVNLFSADEEMIFTDKGFYIRDDSGNAKWTPYQIIEDVIFLNEGRWFFQATLTNGNTTELSAVYDWDEKTGLSGVRLFLLLMARLIGDCEYEFTDEEMAKLSLVTLESLENRPITAYL